MTVSTTLDPFVWPKGQSIFTQGSYTWGVFHKYPQSESLFVDDKWEKWRSCSEPKIGTQTYANFYWKSKDEINWGFLPFYNARGQISGVVQVSPRGWFSWGNNKPLVKYDIPAAAKTKTKTFWGVEVHFRDPTKICDPKAEISPDLWGDRIWFRNGNTNEFLKSPIRQDEKLLKSLGWSKGKFWNCMGTHYTKGLDMLGKVYPYVLLYDQTRHLSGWHAEIGGRGENDVGRVKTAPTWERATIQTININFRENQVGVATDLKPPEAFRHFADPFHAYLRDPRKYLVTDPEPQTIGNFGQCLKLIELTKSFHAMVPFDKTPPLAWGVTCSYLEISKTSGCYCHPAFGKDSRFPDIAQTSKKVNKWCDDFWWGPKAKQIVGIEVDFCKNYTPQCSASKQTRDLGCKRTDQVLEADRYAIMRKFHNNAFSTSLYSSYGSIYVKGVGMFEGTNSIGVLLSILSSNNDLITYPPTKGPQPAGIINSCNSLNTVTYEKYTEQSWFKKPVTTKGYIKTQITFEDCSTKIQSQILDYSQFSPKPSSLLLDAQDKPEFSVQKLCEKIQRQCTGANQQYNSKSACVSYWKTLPKFSSACGSRKGMGKSRSCKFLHTFALASNPNFACWAVGDGTKTPPSDDLELTLCVDDECQIVEPEREDCSICDPDQCAYDRSKPCPSWMTGLPNGQCQKPGRNCKCLSSGVSEFAQFQDNNNYYYFKHFGFACGFIGGIIGFYLGYQKIKKNDYENIIEEELL